MGKRMAKIIDTAFVLAAGRGERLRPLTDKTPKPLLPIGGTTLIEQNLLNLKEAGVSRVVINLWHLGDKIAERLGDGNRYGFDIEYSLEEDLLGTAGGLKNAFPLIDRDRFYLMNADIVTDLNFGKLAASLQDGALATLALRPLADHEKHTPISVSNNKVKKIGEGKYSYMGVGVITRAFVEELPEKFPSCLTKDGIIPMINAGKDINAYIHDGIWFDAGTMDEYNRLKNGTAL